MKITENPELAEVLVDHVRDILAGRRDVPAVNYRRDKSLLHRSDLLDCIMRPFLSRTLEEEPPISTRSALNFLRGRAVERFVGADNEPFIKDDIIITADLELPAFGLVEFKTTAARCGKGFRPYPHWTNECEVLAHAHDVDTVYLAVFHIIGYGLPCEGGNDPVMSGYSLKFTEDERRKAWGELLRRKAILDRAIRSGEPPTAEEVRPTLSAWRKRKGCGDCESAVVCPVYLEINGAVGRPMTEEA